MVQALINISDDANRVLNIIKARHSLKTKSEAINKLADEYEDRLEFKPEYIEKLKRIEKQKPIYIGTPEDMKRYLDALVRDQSGTGKKTRKARP